jgi:MarR family transcriptional regulator, 2-MHQ and catechol-resistance regulon repressor
VLDPLPQRRARALAAYSQLAAALGRLNQLLENQLHGFRLTTGQFQVLDTLLRLGPMNQAELAANTWRTDGDVYQVLQRLVPRGLVVRRAHETDGRKRTVHLTPEGRKLITKVLPLREGVIRARMSVLKKREQQQLERLCSKLAEGDPVKFMLQLTREDAAEGGG